MRQYKLWYKNEMNQTTSHAPLLDLYLKNRVNKDKQLWILTHSNDDKARPDFAHSRVHFMSGTLGKYEDKFLYTIKYDDIYYNYKNNQIVVEPKFLRKPYYTLNVDRYFGNPIKSDVKLRNLFSYNKRINYHLRFYDYGRNRINFILY